MNCDKETVDKISDAGFAIIAFNQDSNGNLTYNSNMMVHVERFFHIYNVLKDNLYRYVITTDVKDVIFQKNPSEWLENNLPKDEDLDQLSRLVENIPNCIKYLQGYTISQQIKIVNKLFECFNEDLTIALSLLETRKIDPEIDLDEQTKLFFFFLGKEIL